jgi:hypothetical protein
VCRFLRKAPRGIRGLLHSHRAGDPAWSSGLGRLDEAEQAIRRAIELQPGATFSQTVLAAIEVQRGNAQAALDAALQETTGRAQDTALALARQMSGSSQSPLVASSSAS